MERVRGILAEGLADVTGRDDALARVDGLIDGYYHLLLDEPDSRDVWAATQSDKELQRLDVEDSRMNGEVLLRHLLPLCRPDDTDRLRALTFLFMHLAGCTVRLAIAVDRPTGDAMVAEFRATVAARLADLLRP